MTAALALAVVLMSQGDEFSIEVPTRYGRLKVHVAVLLVVAAALGLQAVKKLDLTVYHRMLRGAVAFGENLEQKHIKPLLGLEKGMTQAISHFSRFDDAKTELDFDGKFRYTGYNKITAEQKLRSFYAVTTWVLVASALMLLFFTNIAV